jgi:glycosyltransferase involved in cell wall biosynthesis
MKVLVLVSKAVLGGHILSAFTVAKYLEKNGHTVIFAGGRAEFTEVIEKELPFIDVPIPMYHGQEDNSDDGEAFFRAGRQSYFTWKSLRVIPKLREIIKKYDFDLIHAFDSRAYIHGSIAALLEKKPITCTVCGGIDPHYNIPITRKIIVFSDEQRNKMIRQFRWKTERVEVIRTRVDIEKILHDNTAPPVSLSLDPEIPAIMMITSFDGTKDKSIRQVMSALELLVEQDVRFQMVFIGGKGLFWQEMKDCGEKINVRCRRKVFIFTGPVLDAYKLLKDAAIVLGVGRSAFEGMAYAKPTIVVGQTGFAGIVSEQTIEDIAFYNFSGRNQKNSCSPEDFGQALARLIADSAYQKTVGQCGRDFVCKEIDVKGGIARIEKVYKVNIDGNSASFRVFKSLSVIKIMIPIWRDNWWHTIGMPLKRMLGVVK